MSEFTKIEWCDHTFNPWEGCTKVSPGCANCYAETRNARWNGGVAANWGRGAPRRRTSDANWRQPPKWNRQAEAMVSRIRADIGNASEYGSVDYERPRVFCASLADWLDEEVPIDWLADLLTLIDSTGELDWLLLTKRPGAWEDAMTTILDTWVPRCGDRCADIADEWRRGQAPPNVWIGTTVEDQARADERISDLLEIPATVRFLSCEPLLGPVDLSAFMGKTGSLDDRVAIYNFGIDWVICGGESGPGARPMHPDWARSLRDQCARVEVPFFFKQWGEWCSDGRRVGKKAAGRLLDCIEYSEFPN
jgi:protein gp37